MEIIGEWDLALFPSSRMQAELKIELRMYFGDFVYNFGCRSGLFIGLLRKTKPPPGTAAGARMNLDVDRVYFAERTLASRSKRLSTPSLV